MNVKLTTSVCFSVALHQMKLGYPIQRVGWNGKGLWVSLFRKNDPAEGIHTDMTMDYAFIRYPDGSTCPWVPSQSDMLAEDWVIGIGKDIPVKKEDCILKDIIQHLNDGYRARHKSWGPGQYIQRHSCLLDKVVYAGSKVVYAGSDDGEVDLNDLFFKKGEWEIGRSYGQSERKDVEFHEIAFYLNSGYVVRQKYVSCLTHFYDESLKVFKVQNHQVVGFQPSLVSELNCDPSAYPRAVYRWEAFRKGEITK